MFSAVLREKEVGVMGKFNYNSLPQRLYNGCVLIGRVDAESVVLLRQIA